MLARYLVEFAVRLLLLTLMLAGTIPVQVIAAGPDRLAPGVIAPTHTGKERLSDKASDEQRVDDCKVPPSGRTRARSADCGWNAER